MLSDIIQIAFLLEVKEMLNKEMIKREFSFKACMADNKTMRANYKKADKKTKAKILAIILALLTGNFIIGYKSATKSPGVQAGMQCICLLTGFAARIALKKELLK
jgi:hypothetical protein